MLTVSRPQHSPASGGKHPLMPLGQLINHGLFHITETRLPLAFEVLPDGAPQTFLDHMIGVNKGKLQTPGQLSPDSGFTRAGQANQTDYQLEQYPETNTNDA